MKKLWVIAIVAGLSGTVKAQDFTFGPKFGWNITNVSNIDDSKNKLSIHLGAFAEVKINDFLALQPELIYSRQGLRHDKTDGWKYKTRVNYLNIPVLAKLYVLDGLSVDLGPQLGFALNGKDKYKKSGDTRTEKIRHLNTVEVSFAVGLSYNWQELMFSARYNLGLSNVLDKDWAGGNNKNRVFQLGVGYRL